MPLAETSVYPDIVANTLALGATQLLRVVSRHRFWVLVIAILSRFLGFSCAGAVPSQAIVFVLSHFDMLLLRTFLSGGQGSSQYSP